jgi:SIR2-like domain
MQLIPNGPEIPELLLQAHEEGQVVFFCGAGISYAAALPGFNGLVDKIYKVLGTSPTVIEEAAYRREQFDATLDLLERRVPGGRREVRAALKRVLQPKLHLTGAVSTHEALLRLARNRANQMRLVTTNFDRIFERVGWRTKQRFNAHVAPMLPIPKASRWDGVVYLHGLLPSGSSDAALNQLVVTSGDFGLAYLTERWAARFVSELFRNYVVCFVGYSINDPVLRYMMDAVAADRLLGEETPPAFAFGDFTGDKAAKEVEWQAKGVIPILYEVPVGTHDHSGLHSTLTKWSEIYRDGTLGRERIVVECAMTKPSASTPQDNFVDRMLWALSHGSGLAAKRFAELDPVPPLEWLNALSEQKYGHSDLIRFGVAPHSADDSGLRFSFTNRPAPYLRAMWMSVASRGTVESDWDEVMLHVARWLLRHLNDPVLFYWVIRRGGRLHERFAAMIEREMDRLAALERGGNVAELAAIRTNAPNAIPDKAMQTLWRLLLTGHVRAN